MKAARMLFAVAALWTVGACGPMEDESLESVDPVEVEAAPEGTVGAMEACTDVFVVCPDRTVLRCNANAQVCMEWSTCSIKCDGVVRRCALPVGTVCPF
ncbi:hypothetical protein LY474_26740 [Myxococcus stipitatus]|uniref:hypothetical protein n=1 Tax=Myxococcus stipitatus TaxID=83455 RepID=UPI001F31F486|nr:hypothetical protein [Myxococcus stipitatus]MCE9671407.1 hypothetical protein [Myxococcus stipitatus]